VAITDPTDISDLRAWFAADNIVGLVDGDPVAAWDEESGNSLDLAQGTSGARPVYKTGILNGLPVVRFDGSGDHVVRLNTSISPSTGLWTAFAVARRNGTSGIMAVVDNDGPNGARGGQIVRLNALTVESIAFNTGNTAYTDVAGTSVGNGTWHTIKSIRDTTTVEVFVDGSSNGTTSTAGTAVTGGTNALVLGQNGRAITSGGANLYLNGDIAEVVVFSRVLNSTEIDDVEDYLHAKWFAEPVNFTADWGGWTAQMAATPTTYAAMSGDWGSWTAQAEFTTGSVDDAVFTADWGTWSASMAATPVVYADLDAAWGTWTAIGVFAPSSASTIRTARPLRTIRSVSLGLTVAAPTTTTPASSFGLSTDTTTVYARLIDPTGATVDPTGLTITFDVGGPGAPISGSSGSITVAQSLDDSDIIVVTIPGGLPVGRHLARFTTVDGDTIISYPTRALDLQVE
jgi:hypothetical protein